MSVKSACTPRPEVLKDKIEGIIDLANIEKRGKLENKPRAFFDLTYPTADIKRVLTELNNRFSSSNPGAGLFLFEGLKGSGKSHLLLLVYHLLNSLGDGQKWLSNHSHPIADMGMTMNHVYLLVRAMDPGTSGSQFAASVVNFFGTTKRHTRFFKAMG